MPQNKTGLPFNRCSFSTTRKGGERGKRVRAGPANAPTGLADCNSQIDMGLNNLRAPDHA